MSNSHSSFGDLVDHALIAPARVCVRDGERDRSIGVIDRHAADGPFAVEKFHERPIDALRFAVVVITIGVDRGRCQMLASIVVHVLAPALLR